MSVAADAIVELLQSRHWSQYGSGTKIVEVFSGAAPRDLGIEVSAILCTRTAETMERLYRSERCASVFQELNEMDDFDDTDLRQLEAVLIAEGILAPEGPTPIKIPNPTI